MKLSEIILRSKFDVQHVPTSLRGGDFLTALSFQGNLLKGTILGLWERFSDLFTSISWINSGEFQNVLTNRRSLVPLEVYGAVHKMSHFYNPWPSPANHLAKVNYLLQKEAITHEAVDPWRMGSVWENPALLNQSCTNLWKNCLWF